MLPALMLLTGAPPSRAQEPAGVTAAVNPEATGTPPALPTRVLQVGSDIVKNERIAIGSAGQAQLLFSDGSTLTLAPNSDLTIDEFVYNPQTDTAKLAMTAASGVFRFVGGRASKDEPVILTTPTATIGIRGGINFTSIDPQTSATETSQAFGVSTSVTSKSTGETQTIERNGFTLTVSPGGPITVSRMDIGRINGLLANFQGSPGKSGGASSAPDQTSPAAAAVATTNSALTPQAVQPAIAGAATLTSASPINAALTLAHQATTTTAQTIVASTTASSGGSVAGAESFLSQFGNGAFNFVATAPFLRGVGGVTGTFPNPSYPNNTSIGGDSYTGFSSTISQGSSSPMFTNIDNATGSATRSFAFMAGAADLSVNYMRSFARTTASGSPIYSYNETFQVTRTLRGGTLAEFGGDNQALFVRIAGPSISFSATTTLTASGNFPSSVVPGTTSFGPETVTFPASQSLHLILGVPASNLPGNGQLSYQLLGATSPTFTDGSGSPGKFSGTMSVLFGAVPSRFYTNSNGTPISTAYISNVPGFTVGTSFQVVMPNDAIYTAQTIGGAGNPAAQISQPSGALGVVFSEGPFGQPYRFSGSTMVTAPLNARACPSGSCSAGILGVLIGPGGGHAGFSYFIGPLQGSTPGINGVALFRR